MSGPADPEFPLGPVPVLARFGAVGPACDADGCEPAKDATAEQE